MNRRDFFKLGIKKSTQTTTQLLEFGIKAKFKRKFLRPPGALTEDKFLLTCTRCGDCEKACPHDSIHLFDFLRGGLDGGTPFIDPYYKACHFCADMPCIASCKAGALQTRKNQKIPPIGNAKIHLDHCLVTQGQRCDYCFNSCPKGVNAITKREDGTPFIDIENCVGCGQCAYICVSQTGKAIAIEAL